jgi:hypothetical protein
LGCVFPLPLSRRQARIPDRSLAESDVANRFNDRFNLSGTKKGGKN